MAQRSYSIFGQPAPVDTRLTDQSQDELVLSLAGLSLNRGDDLPSRPGFGTVGKPVTLRANFYPVRLPTKDLYEYNVDITPKTAIKRVKRRIFHLAEQNPAWANLRGKVAHDYSSKIISSFKLPQPLELEVPFYDEDEAAPVPGSKSKTYKLTINFVQPIEMESIQR
jgi:eukaryotic translation initiation factor 2C